LLPFVTSCRGSPGRDGARLELPAGHEERAAYIAAGRVEVAGDGFDAGRFAPVPGEGDVIPLPETPPPVRYP